MQVCRDFLCVDIFICDIYSFKFDIRISTMLDRRRKSVEMKNMDDLIYWIKWSEEFVYVANPKFSNSKLQIRISSRNCDAINFLVSSFWFCFMVFFSFSGDQWSHLPNIDFKCVLFESMCVLFGFRCVVALYLPQFAKALFPSQSHLTKAFECAQANIVTTCKIHLINCQQSSLLCIHEEPFETELNTNKCRSYKHSERKPFQDTKIISCCGGGDGSQTHTTRRNQRRFLF